MFLTIEMFIKWIGDCAAWTLNETSYACGLLGAAGWDARQDPTSVNFTSGVERATPGGGQSDTLHLLESDTTLDIRVFMDNTILEVYWQNGRVALTLGLDESDVAGGNYRRNPAAACGLRVCFTVRDCL